MPRKQSTSSRRPSRYSRVPSTDEIIVVSKREDVQRGFFSAPVTGIARFSLVDLFREFEKCLRENAKGTASESEFGESTPTEAITTPGAKLPVIGFYAHTCVQDFIQHVDLAMRTALDTAFVKALQTGVHTAAQRERNREGDEALAPEPSPSDLLSRPSMKRHRDFLLEIYAWCARNSAPVERFQGRGRRAGTRRAKRINAGDAGLELRVRQLRKDPTLAGKPDTLLHRRLVREGFGQNADQIKKKLSRLSARTRGLSDDDLRALAGQM